MKRFQNLRQTVRSQREAGFTLVEIMVVVVIIGMLATLVASNVDLLFGDANRSTAQSECRTIHEAASYYKRKKSRVPTMEELYEKDERGDAALSGGRKDDPWGNPYILRELEFRKFEVISMGEDGLEDTEDDIVYPNRDDDS